MGILLAGVFLGAFLLMAFGIPAHGASLAAETPTPVPTLPAAVIAGAVGCANGASSTTIAYPGTGSSAASITLSGSTQISAAGAVPASLPGTGPLLCGVVLQDAGAVPGTALGPAGHDGDPSTIDGGTIAFTATASGATVMILESNATTYSVTCGSPPTPGAGGGSESCKGAVVAASGSGFVLQPNAGNTVHLAVTGVAPAGATVTLCVTYTRFPSLGNSTFNVCGTFPSDHAQAANPTATATTAPATATTAPVPATATTAAVTATATPVTAIATPVTAAVTPTPAAGSSPCAKLALSSASTYPTATLSVSGSAGCGASGVRLFWESDQQIVGLAEAAVGPAGAFSTSVIVPTDTSPGSYHVCAQPTGAPGATLGNLACVPVVVGLVPSGCPAGTVNQHDPTGALVPATGAVILARDAAGTVIATATADDAGGFSIAALPIGSYTFAATLEGSYLGTTPVVVGSCRGGPPSPHVVVGPVTRLTGPIANFEVVPPYVVDLGGGIAIPPSVLTEPDAEFAILVAGPSAPNTSTPVSTFGSLPGLGKPVYVRYWVDIDWNGIPAEQQGISWDVTCGSGSGAVDEWSSGDPASPIYTGLLNYAFTGWSSSSAGADMDVSEFPAGDCTMTVTPIVMNTVGPIPLNGGPQLILSEPQAPATFVIHMKDLKSRWYTGVEAASPWVSPDSLTIADRVTDFQGTPLGATGVGLVYLFQAELPSWGASHDFNLQPLITFHNSIGDQPSTTRVVEYMKAFGANAITLNDSVPGLQGSLVLLSLPILTSASYNYTPHYAANGDIDYYEVPDQSVYSHTLGPYTLWSWGDTVCVWWVCAGAEVGVNLGINLGVDLGGTIGEDIETTTRNQLGMDVAVTPSIGATISAYAELDAGVCSGTASANATPTFYLPYVFASDGGASGFQSPHATIEFDLSGSVDCLGITLANFDHQFGPYTVFKVTEQPLYDAAQQAPATAPVDPRPAVAENTDGQALAVWTGGEAGAPAIQASRYDGRVWSSAATLSTPGALVYQPAVAWLTGGRAVAVWGQNLRSPAEAQAAGAAALADARLYYALWTGDGWSAPVAMPDAGVGDGLATLTRDPKSGRVLAVWSRFYADDALRATYAWFDGSTWGAAAPLAGTESGLDGRASVQLGADGTGWAAWESTPAVQAGPESDPAGQAGPQSVQLHAARWDGSVWGAPETIPQTDAGRPSFASLALDQQGSPVIAFTVAPPVPAGLNAATDGSGPLLEVAYRRPAGWVTSLALDGVRAEAPVLRVGAGGQALVMARGFGAGGTGHQGGDLLAVGADLTQATPQWTATFLTGDNQANWKTAFDLDAASGRAVVADVKEPVGPTAAEPDQQGLAGLEPALFNVAGGAQVALYALTAATDLLVTDQAIRFSNAQPAPGETVTITATVRNAGLKPAGGFSVRFVEASGGASTTVGEQRVAGLGVGATTNVSVPYTVRQAGVHLISVVVDPDDATKDADRSNNTAQATLGQLEPPTAVVVGRAPDGVHGAVMWQAPAAGDVVKYAVYRSTVPGGGYELVGISTGQTFPDLLSEPGTSYYYVVTAIDRFGTESKYSLEATGRAAQP